MVRKRKIDEQLPSDETKRDRPVNQEDGVNENIGSELSTPKPAKRAEVAPEKVPSQHIIIPQWNANEEPGWQRQFSTTQQAIEGICLSERLSDVRFVPMENAQTPPRKFPAHKFVLSLRSPVLAAVFHYDKMAPVETADGIQEVKLEGVEPDAFEQFLRFVYTDKVELTEDNVSSVLYIANRYDLPSLAIRCEDFMCAKLTPENALEVLDLAARLDYERVKGRALDVLTGDRRRMAALLLTDQFLALSRDALCAFLAEGRIEDVPESELFLAALRWAQKRVDEDVETKDKTEGTSTKPEKTLREVLGPALFHFRFLQFSLKELSELVVPKHVLTSTELVTIFTRLGNPEHPIPRDFPFPLERRQNKWTITLDLGNFTQFLASRDTKSVDIDGDLKQLSEPPVEIRGLPWRIMATLEFVLPKTYRPLPPVARRGRQPVNHYEGKRKWHLGFFVRCEGEKTPKKGKHWVCEAEAVFRLKAKREGQADLVKTFTGASRFSPENRTWGFPQFITVDRLLDSDEGWLDPASDTATLVAEITPK